MESKFKHLELIQGVIDRMASNSFMLKGWNVVLVSALFVVLSTADGDRNLFIIALLPTLVFWILDGYFLRQERLFRALYDKVRLADSDGIDFSMDTKPHEADVESWPWTVLSKTLWPFYGVIAVLVFVIWKVAGSSAGAP